jgi:ADP-ribosyl-[dinitrogen reductase] hydrolase
LVLKKLHKHMDISERYVGCLLGLACGDALGTTVEFSSRGSFEPLTDIVGGGPFDLLPGEWTDDTSMALCLGASLIHCRGFDPTDQMNRYCNWREVGYMSSNGRCFDIGLTTATALDKYLRTGDPFAGDTNHRSAGNGALMRLVPIAMFYTQAEQDVFRFSGESTRVTHGAQEAIDCSRLFGLQLRRALLGGSKEQILKTKSLEPLSNKVLDIAEGRYLEKSISGITGSGYCVESLEAALWCFAHSASYEEAVLKAANLGDDADTTAAICGQIAGAFYGINEIPKSWSRILVMESEISVMAMQLYSLAMERAT